MRFDLGQVVVTAAVSTHFLEREDVLSRPFIMGCIKRHHDGDWGDLDAEDSRANNRAVKDGDRLLSAYLIPDTLSIHAPDKKVWVITEYDRSVTTVLFPSDY